MAQRRPQWSPELQERVSREWTELFRDVEAALGEDPRIAKPQALAYRWSYFPGTPIQLRVKKSLNVSSSRIASHISPPRITRRVSLVL